MLRVDDGGGAPDHREAAWNRVEIWVSGVGAYAFLRFRDGKEEDNLRESNEKF